MTTFATPQGMTTRRQLLRATLAGAVLSPFASLSVAAATAAAGANRFVFIILRGGMDGLSAVPAVGDPAFAEARGVLGAFASEPLPLDGPFALHPLLPQLHAMYGRGELAVLHAVGLPYRDVRTSTRSRCWKAAVRGPMS